MALLIGAGAGVLGTLPMLLGKSPRLEAALPFTHWLMLGVLIAYVKLLVHPAAKGASSRR